MRLLSLSKNYTPYKQFQISGQRGHTQQNMSWNRLLTLTLNYGTLLQMNIKQNFHIIFRF